MTNTDKADRGYAGPKLHRESDEEYEDRKDAAKEAHEARPSIWIRGESGGVFEMDLPLHEGIAERLAAGKVVRVNQDGSGYTGTGDDVTVTEGSRVTGVKEGAQISQTERQVLKDDDDDDDPEVAERERVERERQEASMSSLTRPDDGAPVSDWRTYAGKVESDRDGDSTLPQSMTKSELIKNYG